MSDGKSYHDALWAIFKDRILKLIKNSTPDLRRSTGVLPPSQLPSGGPGGTGYPASPHTHPLADLEQGGATDGQVVTWSDGDGAYIPADAPGGGGGGSLEVNDGTTTVSPTTTLVFPSGTITDNGSGEAEYTPAGGGGSLTIEEVDGTPSESAPTKLIFPNGTLAVASNEVTYTPASSDLMTLIYDAIANGTDDPIDRKIVSGSYIILIWFKGNNTSGWSSPTNALHTVTTGKRFIVVASWGSSAILGDGGSRKARLRNVTDGNNVVEDYYFTTPYGQLNIPYVGDGGTATTLNSAASAKAIELQLWNTDSTKRAMGAIVLGKEV